MYAPITDTVTQYFDCSRSSVNGLVLIYFITYVAVCPLCIEVVVNAALYDTSLYNDLYI